VFSLILEFCSSSLVWNWRTLFVDFAATHIDTFEIVAVKIVSFNWISY
jgi:hypothetical protein